MKLEEAVDNIFNVYSHGNEEKFPYFLIIGAGVSAPEIPLASQIITICSKKCESNSLYDDWKKECESKSPSEKYSFWLSKAYPEKAFRRQFFAKLVNDARITSSNFQIANILASKKVFNLVITTNFDTQIEQSLNLLNFFDYFSSSNVVDNLSINLRTNDVQIVHVHGDYRNYDLKNLTDELNSESINSVSMSMKDVLSNALNNRSAIIIGYSGWENDVVMTTLKERLKYDTPYRFYWFCYDKKTFDTMPDWLKSNDNVCFVYPDGFALQKDVDFLNRLEKMKIANNVVGITSMPAYHVLSTFSTKFSIAVPELFQNPLLPCENIVNHMSKVDSIYDITSLFDEFKALFKIHEHNREAIKKIIDYYNEKKYSQFSNAFKRNFGKKSTMSDSDFNNIFNNYAVKALDDDDFPKELKNDLFNFIFRAPEYRNNDHVRTAAFLALNTMAKFSNDVVDLAKFNKLYSYYEGKNDLIVILSIKMRFLLFPDLIDDLWETEYKLAKTPFDKYKDVFYALIYMCPYYIYLVGLQSMKEDNKKIIADLLKELNKDEHLKLRENRDVREILKKVFKLFNGKSWLNDSLFKTTKELFSLKR